MDPFLLSLLICWYVFRGSVDDARAAVTGKPSPRQLYRQKYGPSGMAQIGNALAGRIAGRISRGPAGVKATKEEPMSWKDAKAHAKWWESVGVYWSELKDDAARAANERMRRRREAREREAWEREAAGEAGETTPPPEGAKATPDGEDGTEAGRRKDRWWRWAWPLREDEPEEPAEPVQATAERADRREAEPVALPAGSAGPGWRAPDLGAEPPEPTRRWDGKPETEADRRLFDERESGYNGPLDSDGYRVPSDDPDAQILEDLARRTDRRMAAEGRAGEDGEAVEGEVVDDGRSGGTLLRSFYGVEIPIPPGVRHNCSACGQRMAVKDDLHVDEGTGGAMVGLRCGSCGIESCGYWALPDDQFEAVFGYPFGEPPDDEDDDTPAGADAPPETGPLRPEGSTTEGEIESMSTPVAEHGLAAFQQYVSVLKESCEQAIPSLDQTISSMVKDGYSGEAIEGLKQAQDDYFPSIIAALETVAEALRRSETVKDAYHGAIHTGSRESVLSE